MRDKTKQPGYYANKAMARKAHLTALMREYKAKPCLDCGVQYPPYVMHLDHRPGETKTATPSEIPTRGWSDKRALEEFSKCDVVCANCHAERTYSRRQ